MDETYARGQQRTSESITARNLRSGRSAYTNTIEGFWSLVKRGIGGTHHAVSAKFLQDYLNEYAFRYHRRDIPEPMFKMILKRGSVTAY